MKFGQLAKDVGGESLPLEVLQSAAGFFLGTQFEHQPFTRESVEYFSTRDAAQTALDSGLWTQRDHL